MTHTAEPFEVAGTAIYRGKVKVAQCLDVDAEELWGEAILPREEWRSLLPSHEQAIANADTLVYRANHYHALRAERDALRAALEHVAIGLNITAADVARLRDDIQQPLTPEFNRLFAHVVIWYDNLRKAEMAARAALKGAK